MWFLIFMISGSWLFAQQLPDYEFYRDNWMMLNPASFSDNYLFNGVTHTVGVTGRYQWIGLDEPPRTIGLQYQAVLEGLNIGLGGTLLNDQTGAIGTTGFYGTFSYLMPLKKKRSRVTQFLSVGMNAGMVQYRVNFSEINFAEPSTANLPMSNQQQYYPDFGIGLFYYADNKFYLGLSVPQLLNINQESNGFAIERQAHFYAMMGGFLGFGGKNARFFIEPSVWLRRVPEVPLSLDSNLRLNFQNVFWLGAGYSLSNALHADLGYTFRDRFTIGDFMKIGVGYAFNAKEYGIELGNTFELNISYAWGKSDRLICPFE